MRLYRNNLKNRFLTASEFPQDLDSLSRLASAQWSFAPNPNPEDLPCQKNNSSCCFGIILFLLFVLLFACNVLRAESETPHRDVVILPTGVVHEGNFFAAGDSVEILGTVNGDVYIFAGQAIVEGIVNGDVLGCGGSFDISGTIKNNCRIASGQVLISGAIGNNVTAVAGNLQMLSSASVGGSLVATAGNVDLAAAISKTATVVASNLRISAPIGGSVEAYVGQMHLTSKAVIGGNVDYQSTDVAWLEQGATIKGAVTHHPSFVHSLVRGTWIQGMLVGTKVVALLMNFFYTLVVGIILIKAFPKNLDAALHVLRKTPLKALSYGVMLLVLLPLASLILLITILGAPFALTLIAANIIGLYTAKIYSILWASNWAFARLKMKPNRMPTLILGLVVYFCLVQIPVAGNILAFASMVIGLGAGVLAQVTRHVFGFRR